MRQVITTDSNYLLRVWDFGKYLHVTFMSTNGVRYFNDVLFRERDDMGEDILKHFEERYAILHKMYEQCELDYDSEHWDYDNIGNMDSMMYGLSCEMTNINRLMSLMAKFKE